jgi:surface antigen
MQGGGVFGQYGGAALDLDEMQRAADLENQVHLQAVAGSQVVQGRHLAEVQEALPEVGDDQGLEQVGKVRAVQQRRLVAKPEQVAGQGRVVEVELRALDQALAEVAVVWIEKENLVSGLQQR